MQTRKSLLEPKKEVQRNSEGDYGATPAGRLSGLIESSILNEQMEFRTRLQLEDEPNRSAHMLDNSRRRKATLRAVGWKVRLDDRPRRRRRYLPGKHFAIAIVRSDANSQHELRPGKGGPVCADGGFAQLVAKEEILRS